MEEQREKVLDIMTSLLKPNGILAFSVVSIYDKGNYGHGEEVEHNTFMKHKDKLLHCYDEQELHAILEPNYEILEKCLHTQLEPRPEWRKKNRNRRTKSMVCRCKEELMHFGFRFRKKVPSNSTTINWTFYIYS